MKTTTTVSAASPAAANPFGLKDGDILLLLALSLGNRIDVDEAANMVLPDPTNPARTCPVPPGSLDRLEDAGLVSIEEAGAVPTDRGRYWLTRWLNQRLKVRGGGRFGVSAVRAAPAKGAA